MRAGVGCRVQVFVLRPPRTVPLQIVHDYAEAGHVADVGERIRAGGHRTGRRVAHVHQQCGEQRRADLVLVERQNVATQHLIGVQVEDEQLRLAVLHVRVGDLAVVDHPQATAVVDLYRAPCVPQIVVKMRMVNNKKRS